jgi:hypothetical protein
MPQAIVNYICEHVRLSGVSLTELAAASGVSQPCLRRLLAGTPFRELRTIESAMSGIGLDLVLRDEAGALVVVPSSRRLPEPLLRRQPAAQIRTGGDGILALLAWRCQHLGINANRLHRRCAIPYASARRLLAGGRMRVSVSLQRLLSTLNVHLLAVTDEGACVQVPLLAADPLTGRRRRDAHAACLRRYRHRHGWREGPAVCGRLAIDKAHVVELRERFGLSYAEIGRIAGVSRHRVRQIVQLLARHGRGS